VLSGTSMATPHVAGVLALAWQQFPSATSTQIIDTVMAEVTPNVLYAPTLGANSPNSLLYANIAGPLATPPPPTPAPISHVASDASDMLPPVAVVLFISLLILLR
jgi:subtilisin family serine protease